MTFNLTILVSGSGTNLQAIIDVIRNGELENCQINAVISNKKLAYGLVRAEQANIQALYHPYISSEITREQYEDQLMDLIDQLKPQTNLVVLAGWMHILGKKFIDQLPVPIINLHPAYPGMFPGKDGIGDAIKAQAKYTGIMVHYVIPEVDAGEVIAKMKIPIYLGDTVDTLKKRIQTWEKSLLLQAIQTVIADPPPGQSQTSQSQLSGGYDDVKSGKVRDMVDLGYRVMAMCHSDRLSSFDRQICEIPMKGSYLNLISSWWFKATRHIIPNHFLHSSRDGVMIVKKCEVIPIEVVVRGYITGSTSTSLWTHYARGIRNYCGIEFPDGLTKNQKLEYPVVTPTTKSDEHDEPISPEQLLKMGLCSSRAEWELISKKALELFEFGSKQAKQMGLILVDTKFEFGRDPVTGQIILIDEVLTPDSSRYWRQNTYNDRVINQGLSPESLDKDLIREWLLRSNKGFDPYDQNQPIPEIPKELLNKVAGAYQSFYQKLINKNEQIDDVLLLEPCKCFNKTQLPIIVNEYFTHLHSPTVVIISDTDQQQHLDHLAEIQQNLQQRHIYSIVEICHSSHETPQLLLLLETYMDYCDESDRRLIFCTVPDQTMTLSTLVAGNCNIPVFCCPPPTQQKISNFAGNSMIVRNPNECAEAIERILYHR